VNVVGRVCCDSVGKLNASSLMLEGSLDLSYGQQVKVDLTNLQQFALFPGQVKPSTDTAAYTVNHKVLITLYFCYWLYVPGQWNLHYKSLSSE